MEAGHRHVSRVPLFLPEEPIGAFPFCFLVFTIHITIPSVRDPPRGTGSERCPAQSEETASSVGPPYPLSSRPKLDVPPVGDVTPGSSGSSSIEITDANQLEDVRPGEMVSSFRNNRMQWDEVGARPQCRMRAYRHSTVNHLPSWSGGSGLALRVGPADGSALAGVTRVIRLEMPSSELSTSDQGRMVFKHCSITSSGQSQNKQSASKHSGQKYVPRLPPPSPNWPRYPNHRLSTSPPSQPPHRPSKPPLAPPPLTQTTVPHPPPRKAKPFSGVTPPRYSLPSSTSPLPAGSQPYASSTCSARPTTLPGTRGRRRTSGCWRPPRPSSIIW